MSLTRSKNKQYATVLTLRFHFCSMSALPTPHKKLLALRKRLCDEGLGVHCDDLWQVEVRVERSKRPGSESQRKEVLAHCVWYST